MNKNKRKESVSTDKSQNKYESEIKLVISLKNVIKQSSASEKTKKTKLWIRLKCP